MSTYDVIEDQERKKAILIMVTKDGKKFVHSEHDSFEEAEKKGEEIFGSIDEETPNEAEVREETISTGAELVRRAISHVKEPEEAPQETMEGTAIVAQGLSGELGSDKTKRGKGEVDMRRMSINSPEGVLAKLWFTWRGTPEGGKSKFLEHLAHEDDNYSVSEAGTGRKQVIHETGATVGGHVGEMENKPGWLQRNVTNRGWKEDQEKEERGY